MKLSKFIINIITLFLLCTLHPSCKKFLDAKSDQSLSTPSTLSDLEALTNAPFLYKNTRMNNNLSDEYEIPYSIWQLIGKEDQDSYIWAPNLNALTDWVDTYKKILHCNTILDNLAEIETPDVERSNSIKGTTLFFRSLFFYQISQLYALQYDKATSVTDLGIPLRLNSDFNEPSTRASIEQTYQQILNDLQEAASLVPPRLPSTKTDKYRPTRIGCYALLARIYLQMTNYQKAKEFADSCISNYDFLLDYNSPTVNPGSMAPLPQFNSEILTYSLSSSPLNAANIAVFDNTVYASYDSNDLRKTVFFAKSSTGTYYYKGPYSGTVADLYNGLALDEVYLIRAESLARSGDINAAVSDLNKLLSKRWKTGTYTPVNNSVSQNQLIQIILTERRKELLNRGTRWSDLKRLNKESAYATLVKRNLNGTEYTLPILDPKYVLLVPLEIMLKTTIQQNAR